jgi:hypothetical protein
MNKELSGAAGDVLHALFFRGALVMAICRQRLVLLNCVNWVT